MFYITVAGDAIRGDSQAGSGKDPGSKAKSIAFQAYSMVCGQGDVTGDGIVPLCAAHLPGPGVQEVTLPGVLHSINEAGTSRPTDRWYGAELVVDRWLEPVLDELPAYGFAGPLSPSPASITAALSGAVAKLLA